jgi:hypothetical protein
MATLLYKYMCIYFCTALYVCKHNISCRIRVCENSILRNEDGKQFLCKRQFISLQGL